MSSTTGFIPELMNHIMKGANIPKVQVERVVGPVLGFFIADVLTATLAEDPVLSGDYVMLCPEFPLKKTDDNQSTNIDWLLFNKTRKELVLLELKTTDTTFSSEQAGIYLKKRDEINEGGADFLLNNFQTIAANSTESGKYQFVLEELDKALPDFRQAVSECRKARVVYLVPNVVKTAGHSEFERMDKVLSFGDLADDIAGPFSGEWRAIKRSLEVLDSSSRRSRNGQQEVCDRDNYDSRVDFLMIKEECAKRGATIEVGFTGGEPALRKASPEYLESRLYKWDSVESGRGTKIRANWIPGDRFLEIANGVGQPMPGSKRSDILNQPFMLSCEQRQQYEAWVRKQFRDFLGEGCLEGLEVSVRFTFGPLGRSVEARVEGSDVRLAIEDALQS
ncbi:hypothetical protein PA01_06110 [Azoarcus sp. PA01]|nr:hypothetical protein PA01_06110 [Azoarcus sp. PA01]